MSNRWVFSVHWILSSCYLLRGPWLESFHRLGSVFFHPLTVENGDGFKSWSPAVFFGRDLFGCPRHIYRNAMKCLSSTCYNMFLHNYLNTIVSQTYVSSLSFPRRLTSFQPFPMDASVAFGGSDFLHWGWWKCLNFVITWGPLRPWTVNKVMSFLPGTLVWRIHSYAYAC